MDFPKHIDTINTPARRQSKTPLTIDDCGSKIDRNSVFDCHLSPVGRQMAIESSVFKGLLSTFVDFRLPPTRCYRCNKIHFVFKASQVQITKIISLANSADSKDTCIMPYATTHMCLHCVCRRKRARRRTIYLFMPH